MDERALQNIIDTFQELKAAYQPILTTESPITSDKDSVTFLEDGLYLKFQDESLAKYKKFIAKWDRPEWIGKWSTSYRSSKLKTAIVKAFRAHDGGRSAFLSLVEQLDEEPTRFRVLIPLTGIDLELDTLKVGKVELVRMTDERVSSLTDKVDIIIESTTNGHEAKASYKAQARDTIEFLKGATCVQITSAGDPTFVKEIAETESLPVIDLLQLIVGLFLSPAQEVRVDFRPAAAGYRPTFIISEDGTYYVPTMSRYGAVGSCKINAGTLAKLEEIHLSDLLDILKKDASGRTDIESFILRAVHWFADGELQRNKENQLQSYVTCLDMFFSSRHGEATSAVQDGVAYLMGHDSTSRIDLHKFIGEVYDYRSRASHEGTSLDVDSQLVQLRALTVNFIAVMLKRRNEFATKKAIKDWVHVAKMT